MKNIIAIIVVVFAFAFTTQAQKKGRKASAEKMLKKMTKDLNLTETQQNKIKPILVAEVEQRKALNKKRKAMKDAGEKPSKEERKLMRKNRMVAETAMRIKMEAILDKEQFAKFVAMAKEKKEKSKNKKKRQ